MSAPLCEIDGLSVFYDRHGTAYALAGIDLAIEAGERLALIGESGSGKSTLGRTLAKLLPEKARVNGHIRWAQAGQLSQDGLFPMPGRDIAYVFQDPGSSLNPVLTIGEQIAEGARRHLGLSWRQARILAGDQLERVQLPNTGDILNAFPHQLSGGQRQRVAIAAAIAARPKILIADEATSALDTVSQAAIARLLDDLVRQEGMTLIFITHDIALASSLSDRIAVLQAGRLVESGKTSTVLGNPADPYTRELIAAHIDLSTPPLVQEVRL